MRRCYGTFCWRRALFTVFIHGAWHGEPHKIQRWACRKHLPGLTERVFAIAERWEDFRTWPPLETTP